MVLRVGLLLCYLLILSLVLQRLLSLRTLTPNGPAIHLLRLRNAQQIVLNDDIALSFVGPILELVGLIRDLIIASGLQWLFIGWLTSFI